MTLAGMMTNGRRPSVAMRDYQEDGCAQVKSEWAEGRSKVLLCLPTGSGKTLCAGALIRDEVASGGRVLVATNMKKLTRQFAHRTEQDFGIPCGIEMGAEGHGGEDVVCCTIQTINNRIAKGKFHPEQFTLLCFDEAHLALADSFQRVAKHFVAAKILGLTATPRRGDRKDLMKFFDSMVEPVTLSQLIDQGHLAPLTVVNIPVSIRLEHEGRGDFDEDEIGHAIEPYLEACADEMIEKAGSRCSLAFLPLKVTSRKFTELLNDRGLKTEHVDGDMDEAEVNSAIKRLELGKISCLSSSMLLTIGVDIRPVNCIVNLRPTRSWTLFVQIVGRGTRTFNPLHHGPKGTVWPAKEDCILMDPLWLTNDHSLLQRPSVLISSSEEEQKLIDKVLSKGGGGGLMQAKASAQAEREEQLRRRLEAMRKKQARTIDAMELFSRTGHMELADYIPMARWELEAPTPKQIEFLLRQKVAMESVTSKGQAAKLIDVFMERRNKGLATGGQVKFCAGLGVPEEDAWKMTFQEASDYLNKNAPTKPSWQRR